jgi:hypothetical protein
MDWIAVALEEYKTLRQESLASIEQMQRTLQIGLVAIGVTTGFGVNASGSGPGVQVAIATATPAFAALIVVMWLDELRRAVFAGAHVARVEHAIGKRFPDDTPPLVWEQQIQIAYDPESGYRYVRHWSTTAALFAATTPVAAVAMVRLANAHEWTLLVVSAVAIVAIVTLTVLYQRGVHNAMTTMHLDTRTAIGVADGAAS